MTKKDLDKLYKKVQEHITLVEEDEYQAKFAKFARYVDNGIYNIGSHYSTDTRELFIMWVAAKLDIPFVK